MTTHPQTTTAGLTDIGLRIANTYPTGEFTHDLTATVQDPEPAALQDAELLDEWAAEHLFPLTGEGTRYSHVEAFYEVTVTDCTQHPALVGRSFNWCG